MQLLASALEIHFDELGLATHRSCFRSSGGNDNGVLHGVVLLEGLDELSNSGSLLTNSNVDTIQLLLLITTIVPSLLVKDGVETDGSLACLTITNDQFTLTTANGNHGIDGLETSLDRLVDRLARQNAGSLELCAATLLGVKRALAVDRVTKSINNTAKQLSADGDVDLKKAY